MSLTKVLNKEAIFSKRLELGLTQSQVAEMVRNRRVCTLSENHYRRIEKGYATPNVVIGMEIASVLDTDVYELWG